MEILRSRRTLAIFMYVFILRAYPQTVTTEADNTRNIQENMFLKILCISN